MKRLRAEHRDDVDFRTMFFDEARLAGCVRHANVVSVIDVGEDDEGPFLVMDYVEGVPLSAIIKHAQRAEAGVPMQVALRIGLEVARGLHAAHEALGPDGAPLALVHRDVSPQNILVGFDGVTRVTDFGVAKAYGRSTHTVAGVLKGKLGYMSPEQLRFEPLDRRADLFSLGVVLYECFAGARLYRSVDDYDGVRRILDEAPPDLGEVREDAPPKLVELVFALLGKDRAQRPATAEAVARVLDEVLGEVEVAEGKLDVGQFVRDAFAVERELQSTRAKQRPAETPAPQVASERTRMPWVAIAAIALLALVIGTGVALFGAGLPASAATTGPAAEPAASAPPTDGRETGALTSNRETGTQETGTQETGTPETGTQETGTQETGTQETGTQTAAHETGTPETGTPETATRESGTETDPRATSAREAERQAAGTPAREPRVRAARSRASGGPDLWDWQQP